MKKSLSLILLLSLFCITALAQAPKKIVAVYMAGKEPTAVKGSHKVLGTELAKALTQSGTYTAVDRTEAGRKIVAQEHIFQRSGAVDSKQIKKLGKQLGVQIVCIAEITEVMKSHYLEARFVDVETAEILNIVSKPGNMAVASDIVRTAQAVAYELVTGETKAVNYSFKEIEYNPNMAIEDYTEAIRLEPNVAEYYYKRGIAYYIKKDYDRAIPDIGEAIRLKSDEALYYFVRGIMYMDKNNYNKAIEDYTEGIRLNPDFSAAYNNRGNAYQEKKDYDRAIADYDEAIRLNPNDAKTYINRGAAYYKKEDYDRAIADYDEVIRLNPNDAKTYSDRGAVYADKKNYDKAITDHNEAIRLEPKYASAYSNRGIVYYYKRDYDRAISDFTQAIRLNPNLTTSYLNRGNAYRSRDDHDKAISDFSEAIRLDPNNALAYYSRGNAYFFDKEDYDRAISDYNETIRLYPNNANAYNNRGAAYYYKNDYNRAIADNEAALRINPNHPGAKRDLNMLYSKRDVAYTDRGGGGNMLTDTRDGKKYKTVKIGSQTWMAENLNYNANGSKCYDNNSGNCDKYGRLYNWNTARSACPSGWHLPSRREYETLDNAVGGEKIAGKKLKAKSGWNSHEGKSGNGTDEFGFSALPGGYGLSDGGFLDVGRGFWWSSTENDSDLAYNRRMIYNYSGVHRDLNYNKSYLLSVRCVQD